MKIDTSGSYIHTSTCKAKALKFNCETASTSTQKSKITKQPDFTNLTRSELRQWVNSQIQSGKMTLEESSPFLQ